MNATRRGASKASVTPPAPATAAGDAGRQHTASVQSLVLPEGIYAFRVPGDVRSAGDSKKGHDGGLVLPAILVGPGPAVDAKRIELYSAPTTIDRWLTSPGDHVTVCVRGGNSTVMLTSLRRPDDSPLTVEATRLDQPLGTTADVAASLRVLAHVQILGDLFFTGRPAGPICTGLSIEAFIVECRDAAQASLAEYRAVTSDGFETPWLTDGMLCGSRGRGVPLLGFAVRPRVLAVKRWQFQCRGYFHRAGWVDADDDGWVRSPHADDPLEGMDVRLEELA